MASPNATFTEMVTTTHRNHPSMVYDNMSKHNALFARLHKRGKVKRISGGYEIVRALDYAENSTFQWYDGYETLDTGQSDVLTAAKYDWKQANVNIVASGRELRMNMGREQIIDLAEAKSTNAARTMTNKLSEGMYSDGTGSSGKEIGGLDLLIQTDGLGTVGGINASTYTFWRNQFKDGGTITTTNILSSMNELWLDVVRGADKPDLIVSSNEIFNTYWNALQPLQRYASADTGEAGFTTLKFVNTDVIHDGGSGITANRMFFLNTNYLEMVVHRDADMSVQPKKESTNQDAAVIPMIFMGNLVCSNRARQGVLFT